MTIQKMIKDLKFVIDDLDELGDVLLDKIDEMIEVRNDMIVKFYKLEDVLKKYENIKKSKGGLNEFS